MLDRGVSAVPGILTRLGKHCESTPGSRAAAGAWGTAIFVTGALVRLGSVMLGAYPQQLSRPEPINIAVSLATHGTYADAYGPGIGPPAHCAPLHPLFLSALIRMFGVHAHAALAISVAASIRPRLRLLFYRSLRFGAICR